MMYLLLRLFILLMLILTAFVVGLWWGAHLAKEGETKEKTNENATSTHPKTITFEDTGQAHEVISVTSRGVRLRSAKGWDWDVPDEKETAYCSREEQFFNWEQLNDWVDSGPWKSIIERNLAKNAAESEYKELIHDGQE